MALVDGKIVGGKAVATPALAAAYLRRNNPTLAESEVLNIVGSYWYVGPKVGVAADGAFAQACHETDCFKFGNQVPASAHNPAGIGAINDGRSYLSFPDWPSGVAVQFAHLLAWCNAPGGEKSPRRALVDQVARESGYARTWRDLGGRWAVPGTGYGDAIERHWQGILSEGGKVATQYADKIELLPESNNNRPMTKLARLDYVVWHETDNENAGATAEMHHRYLLGDPDASFHFCVDADESIQFLPVDEVGWHIGDGADSPLDAGMRSVGIEVCVNDRARYRQACQRAAKVAARVIVGKGLTLAALRYHGSFWSPQNPAIHKGCPRHVLAGDWGVRWADVIAMVGAEMAALNGGGATKVPIGPDEAKVLKAWAETLIPFEVRGNLTREGIVDLRAFGGRADEWLALYERVATHRLNGANYVMRLEDWDALRKAGKVILY